MRKLVVFFFVCIVVAKCQNDTPVQTKAFTSAPTEEASKAPLQESSSKQPELPAARDVLEKVMARLWPVVKEQYNVSRPKVRWNKGKSSHIAVYIPPTKDVPHAEIWVDTFAYNALLKTLGTEKAEYALAIIVGHELGHHVYRAQYENQPCYYTMSGSNSAAIRPIGEAACDYFGAFTAYLAGYPAKAVMPDAVASLYAAYQLDEGQMVGYLPLQERKRVAAYTAKDIGKLIFMFQCANTMASAHFHQEATILYEAVHKFYPGKEVKNNLGANLLLAALWKDKNQRLAFPVELVWQSRLQEARLVLGGDDVSQAIQYLEEALAIDPLYQTARLNLLCAYALNSNLVEAGKQYDTLQLQIRGSESLQKHTEARIALASAYTNTFINAGAKWKNTADSAQAAQILLSIKNDPLVPNVLREMAANNLSVLTDKWEKPGVSSVHLPKALQALKLPQQAKGPLQPVEFDGLNKRLAFKWDGPGSDLASFISGKQQYRLQFFKSGQLPPDAAKSVRNMAKKQYKVLGEEGHTMFFPETGLGFRLDNHSKMLEWFKFEKI
jgi:uncharacterized protein (UPF0147 family)